MTAGSNFIKILLHFDKYIDKLEEKKQPESTGSFSRKHFFQQAV